MTLHTMKGVVSHLPIIVQQGSGGEDSLVVNQCSVDGAERRGVALQGTNLLWGSG